MINAHKQNGHGVQFKCLLSRESLHTAGSIFVDDTDLEHYNMRKVETTVEAHRKLQESILNWGKLLLATGGALKPVKSFYHLISFRWKPDGSWG
jgi:hypothetical protein